MAFSRVPPWPVQPALLSSLLPPDMQPSVSMLPIRFRALLRACRLHLPRCHRLLRRVVFCRCCRKSLRVQSLLSLSDESVLSGVATSRNITGQLVLGWRVLLFDQRPRAPRSGAHSGPILLPVQKLLFQKQNASDSCLGWSTSSVTLPAGRRSPLVLQPSMGGRIKKAPVPPRSGFRTYTSSGKGTGEGYWKSMRFTKQVRKRLVMLKVVSRSVVEDSPSPTRTGFSQRTHVTTRSFGLRLSYTRPLYLRHASHDKLGC